MVGGIFLYHASRIDQSLFLYANVELQLVSVYVSEEKRGATLCKAVRWHHTSNPKYDPPPPLTNTHFFSSYFLLLTLSIESFFFFDPILPFPYPFPSLFSPPSPPLTFSLLPFPLIHLFIYLLAYVATPPPPGPAGVGIPRHN